MFNLLHVVPLIVLLLEYVAVSAALNYARFAVEAEAEVVGILGGIIKVGAGGDLPYEAVPSTVLSLHLAALVLSVIYFVYFIFFAPSAAETTETIPPLEG